MYIIFTNFLRCHKKSRDMQKTQNETYDDDFSSTEKNIYLHRRMILMPFSEPLCHLYRYQLRERRKKWRNKKMSIDIGCISLNVVLTKSLPCFFFSFFFFPRLKFTFIVILCTSSSYSVHPVSNLNPHTYLCTSHATTEKKEKRDFCVPSYPIQ